MRDPIIFTSSHDRPNISITIHICKREEAIKALVAACSSTTLEGSSIIFTYTRKDAELLHREITRTCKTPHMQGARLYHGQIAPDERRSIERLFNEGVIKTVVATGSSFATGIDVGDIRQIFLFTLPKTFEVCVSFTFYFSFFFHIQPEICSAFYRTSYSSWAVQGETPNLPESKLG